jgi:L-2-hydroxyglutarate oxidase LhgO
VTGIEKKKDGFIVRALDVREGFFSFSSRVVVNCAGLYSDKVARMAGIRGDEYALKFCKGDYFRVSPTKSKLIDRLVYPVPKEDRVGLGIHATLDLAGSLRLGPDDEYVEKIDYSIKESKRRIFCESARKFLPFIEETDLSGDTSGIRPKLQGPQEGFRDFLIRQEADKGLEGLIDLVGIESPGLTACLSIAGLVSRMIKDIEG